MSTPMTLIFNTLEHPTLDQDPPTRGLGIEVRNLIRWTGPSTVHELSCLDPRFDRPKVITWTINEQPTGTCLERHGVKVVHISPFY